MAGAYFNPFQAGLPLGVFSGRGPDFSALFNLAQLANDRARGQQQMQQFQQAQRQSLLQALGEREQQQRQFDAQLQQRKMESEADRAAQVRESDLQRAGVQSRFDAEQRRLIDQENARILRENTDAAERRSFMDAARAEKEAAANEKAALMREPGEFSTSVDAANKYISSRPADLDREIAALDKARLAGYSEWESLRRQRGTNDPVTRAAYNRVVALDRNQKALQAERGSIEVPKDEYAKLDAVEARLRQEAMSIQDESKRARRMVAIDDWRDREEAKLGRKESRQSLMDAREANAENQKRGKDIMERADREQRIKNMTEPLYDELTALRKRYDQFKGAGIADPERAEAWQKAAEEIAREIADVKAQIADIRKNG